MYRGRRKGYKNTTCKLYDLLLYMYTYYIHVHKSKQGNTTNLNISFPWKMKKELLRWDSNPQHTAYEADALTELPRQLSWLG